MAAFDLINNMNDVALRPRLLRTVIRDYIPDNKHPFGSPTQLSKVVSMVKTHNLLSEAFGELTDQKLIGNWKSAVDSWVERLLLLVSNDMPDKCWAGICLLGVTCQECSSDRFLASYSDWFQKLLSHIQLPAASHFVKVASCASISDLLIRLGGFPYVKKDGTAHAGKLIQPVLKLLNDEHSEAIWDGAIHLLCTIITFFPFSIGRHYESVEAAVASKFLSGTCSFNMLKKLAHCLALLPKSRGDEDSWSLMMRKILIWINNHLNEAFQGFEETKRYDEAVRLLLPPGKDLPPPFGGLTVSGEQSHSMRKRSEHLLTSSVSALMLCCSTMVTSSYPVQVTVPVRSLLTLVERVLMVDASLPPSLQPFVTAMQQEFLSSELPVLHLHSLELLTAIIKGVRSQLLPHAASIVRLISVYFEKCALPELRTKIYSITKILLISMGVGMGVCLASEVVNNAFLDLSPSSYESGGASSTANSMPSTESLPQPSRRKRKHGSTTGTLEGHDGSLEVRSQKNYPTTLISLRIAALEALEALLTVGGDQKHNWRSDLDLLLINILKNSSKGGWASEERNIIHPDEPTEIWANVQLAALRTLLASFLSSYFHSKYLAQGLELFRRGKQETGTKLAEFCAHALLALEVFIHPRALSVDDFPTTKFISDEVHYKNSENLYSHNLKLRILSSSGTQGIGEYVHDPDDRVDSDYAMDNGIETEAAVNDPVKTINYNENPSETLTVHQDIKLSVNGSDKEIAERSKRESAAANADEDLNSMPLNGGSASAEASSVPANTDGLTGSQSVFEKFTSGSDTAEQAGNDMASGQDISVDKINCFTSTTLNIEKGKGIASEMDHESDTDEYPDLLNEDPDSDSNQEEEF